MDRLAEQLGNNPLMDRIKSLRDSEAARRMSESFQDVKEKLEHSENEMIGRMHDMRQRFTEENEAAVAYREIRMRHPSFDMPTFLRSIKQDVPVVIKVGVSICSLSAAPIKYLIFFLIAAAIIEQYLEPSPCMLWANPSTRNMFVAAFCFALGPVSSDSSSVLTSCKLVASSTLENHHGCVGWANAVSGITAPHFCNAMLIVLDIALHNNAFVQVQSIWVG
jgi:hypothetical protein